MKTSAMFFRATMVTRGVSTTTTNRLLRLTQQLSTAQNSSRRRALRKQIETVCAPWGLIPLFSEEPHDATLYLVLPSKQVVYVPESCS